MNSIAIGCVVNSALEDYTPFLETMKEESTLSMVVVGVARFLARTKIFYRQQERGRRDRWVNDFRDFGDDVSKF